MWFIALSGDAEETNGLDYLRFDLGTNELKEPLYGRLTYPGPPVFRRLSNGRWIVTEGDGLFREVTPQEAARRFIRVAGYWRWTSNAPYSPAAQPLPAVREGYNSPPPELQQDLKACREGKSQAPADPHDVALLRWWVEASELDDWIWRLKSEDGPARRAAMFADLDRDDGMHSRRHAFERLTAELIGWCHSALPGIETAPFKDLAGWYRQAFSMLARGDDPPERREVYEGAMFAHDVVTSAWKNRPVATAAPHEARPDIAPADHVAANSNETAVPCRADAWIEAYDALTDQLFRNSAKVAANLLKYMRDREKAQVHDIAEEVHDNDTLSEGAIRANLVRVNDRLANSSIPVRFRIASGYVHKIVDPD